MNKSINVLIFLCVFYMIAHVIRAWGFWKIYEQNEIYYVCEEEIINESSKKLFSLDSFEDEYDVKTQKDSLLINEPIKESINDLNLQSWTEEELEYLACAIYQEAGADYISDKTRLMVGCVIMNRVEHELYPDTIFEVLTQERQYGRFYWTGIVWPDRASKPEEFHAVQRAYDIVELVLNGERLLDENYIFQAEFIQTDDYILQDGVYFCRYNDNVKY